MAKVTRSTTYIINSVDRVSSSDSNIDFRVQPYPRNALILSVELKYASIPFAFKNVTATYGNSIFLRVRLVPAGPFHDITITLPSYYYTIPQLVAEINTQLAAALVLIPTAVVIQFSISANNQYLELTSNTTGVTVISNHTNIPAHLRYVYVMLGLNAVNNSVFTFPSLSPLTLPFPFTQDLPFRYLLLYLDTFPSDIFTTHNVTASFFIDVSNYRPILSLSPTEIADNSTVVYFPETTCRQVIQYIENYPKMTSLRVVLLDQNNNSLIEHSHQREWNFALNIYFTNE